MYRAFDLSLRIKDDDPYVEKGKKLKVQTERAVYKTLEPFLKKNGILDGTLIRDNWFPTVSADVFISHSHSDENTALALAGFLNEMGVTPFIDSAAWGYSPELLKIIDAHGSKTGDNSYSYERRNGTTSHVHMMLATALAKMLDCCESVFFINTPNSITSTEVSELTSSPWIFYELATLNWIRPLTPKSHRLIKVAKSLNESVERQVNFSIDYKVDLKNLAKLDLPLIEKWKARVDDQSPTYPLDLLYKLVPVPQK